jgi:Large ribosomal RNA subunit accumulation protein YceD
MTKAGSLWSVPVAVENIPEAGLHMAIEASATTRAAVAELADLRDLPELSAVFDLTRQGAGADAGVRVTGQVSARVGQTCVVTLEPIESVVAEAVDLKFVPLPGGGAAVEPKGPRKRALLGDDEPPEPLVDGSVDLGQLATEFLILGVDPYPRKPGAQFAAPKVEDAGEHPFAALESLKKNLGGDQK